MTTDEEALRRLAVRTLMPGFAGSTVPAWIVREYAAGLAAVCLYGANVVDAEQFSKLCADLRAVAPDLVLAVDEEGGDVTRLHFATGSPHPGNAVLGRLDDLELTRASAGAIGLELTASGITLDLAPVVDVNSADDNPVIGVRSFGREPALVARHAAAFVDALQSVGVAACAKHFPGHGDTTTDSHLALPRIDVPREVLAERELEPFRAAVAAGTACIMTSHIVVTAIDAEQPATFSHLLLQGLLRDELGFDGVVVTDALDMAGASAETGIPEAAVRALVAGCDLLCVGSETSEEEFLEIVEAVVLAIAAGRLDQSRVEEAVGRVEGLVRAFPPGRVRDGGAVPGEEVVVSDAAIARAFEVGPAVAALCDAPGRAVVVQLASATNLAVGDVRWGPAAVGRAIDETQVEAGDKVAVVGRGLSERHPAWTLAESLRSQGHSAIVVECGWPRSGGPAAPDIVTFGGSPSVGRALANLLGCQASAPAPGRRR
ncbi:MAG: glycoside hydrolase family 3 protein [Terracoccus sp.]